MATQKFISFDGFFKCTLMTVVTTQCNKTVPNEVKDNWAPLEPSYGEKNPNTLFCQPNILKRKQKDIAGENWGETQDRSWKPSRYMWFLKLDFRTVYTLNDSLIEAVRGWGRREKRRLIGIGVPLGCGERCGVDSDGGRTTLNVP